jgi:hypothetical protein
MITCKAASRQKKAVPSIPFAVFLCHAVENLALASTICCLQEIHKAMITIINRMIE